MRRPSTGLAWRMQTVTVPEKIWPEPSNGTKKSARQGHVVAQRSLALIYLNGQEEIDRNWPLALAWYSLLAEEGNQMDIHRRDALLQELSDEEISESREITTRIRTHLAVKR